MKRVVLLAVSLLVSAAAFAGGSDFSRWNWPLVSEWQTYESGVPGPKEGTVGGLAWPSTKPLADPFQSARYGTLNQGKPTDSKAEDPLDPAKKGNLAQNQPAGPKSADPAPDKKTVSSGG